MTLFAFDAGQSLTEHTSPYEALVTVLEGEAEITIAGQAQRVPAGELLRLPANVPHALRAEMRFKMTLTMIRALNPHEKVVLGSTRKPADSTP